MIKLQFGVSSAFLPEFRIPRLFASHFSPFNMSFNAVIHLPPQSAPLISSHRSFFLQHVYFLALPLDFPPLVLSLIWPSIILFLFHLHFVIYLLFLGFWGVIQQFRTFSFQELMDLAHFRVDPIEFMKVWGKKWHYIDISWQLITVFPHPSHAWCLKGMCCNLLSKQLKDQNNFPLIKDFCFWTMKKILPLSQAWHLLSHIWALILSTGQ